MYFNHNRQLLFSNFLHQQGKNAEICQQFLIQCSTDAEDVKMLLDILSPMNNVTNDQLSLNSVHICPDNILQILRKSLLCFAKIWKIDFSKSPKSGL